MKVFFCFVFCGVFPAFYSQSKIKRVLFADFRESQKMSSKKSQFSGKSKSLCIIRLTYPQQKTLQFCFIENIFTLSFLFILSNWRRWCDRSPRAYTSNNVISRRWWPFHHRLGRNLNKFDKKARYLASPWVLRWNFPKNNFQFSHILWGDGTKTTNLI